mmetsp:Transcript_35108/g.111599  ORF Transcript_35108/g.111599 Transcript_35108/m.111599 type:complete len:264 (+) Transcript_35108:2015-2806(+)
MRHLHAPRDLRRRAPERGLEVGERALVLRRRLLVPRPRPGGRQQRVGGGLGRGEAGHDARQRLLDVDLLLDIRQDLFEFGQVLLHVVDAHLRPHDLVAALLVRRVHIIHGLFIQRLPCGLDEALGFALDAAGLRQSVGNLVGLGLPQFVPEMLHVLYCGFGFLDPQPDCLNVARSPPLDRGRLEALHALQTFLHLQLRLLQLCQRGGGRTCSETPCLRDLLDQEGLRLADLCQRLRAGFLHVLQQALGFFGRHALVAREEWLL